jgi:hypothetical protein
VIRLVQSVFCNVGVRNNERCMNKDLQRYNESFTSWCDQGVMCDAGS